MPPRIALLQAAPDKLPVFAPVRRNTIAKAPRGRARTRKVTRLRAEINLTRLGTLNERGFQSQSQQELRC
jgi:hypothetical protein